MIVNANISFGESLVPRDKHKKEEPEKDKYPISPSKASLTSNDKNLSYSQKKPIKNGRCNYDTCSKKTAKIIGDCRYCSNKFCESHRLPESHSCTCYDKVRCESKNILKNKLMNEKCVGVKISQL